MYMWGIISPIHYDREELPQCIMMLMVCWVSKNGYVGNLHLSMVTLCAICILVGNRTMAAPSGSFEFIKPKPQLLEAATFRTGEKKKKTPNRNPPFLRNAISPLSNLAISRDNKLPNHVIYGSYRTTKAWLQWRICVYSEIPMMFSTQGTDVDAMRARTTCVGELPESSQ